MNSAMCKKNKTFLISMFLVTLLIVVCGCDIEPSQLLLEQTVVPPSPVIGARIISQNFSENVVWRKNGVYIRLIPVLPPVLLAGHGYVAFLDFIGGPLSSINQLEVLDAKTGMTLWQSERFSDHEAIALSRDKALVLLDLGSSLDVYDIGGNGEPLHSYSYFKEFTQFYIFPVIVEEEENLYIYYRQGNKYFLHSINLEGEKVDKPRAIQVQVSGQHPRLLLFDDSFSLMAGESEYVAIDFETGGELWRIAVSEQITKWPVLGDDLLIIPAGTSLRNKLMAIDIKTGALLWETEKEFGSNAALHRGELYALRNDAVLVRLNLTTGQVEEKIPFEPAHIDAGMWAYLLASDGERLFVYFGDSQELFALKTP